MTPGIFKAVGIRADRVESHVDLLPNLVMKKWWVSVLQMITTEKVCAYLGAPAMGNSTSQLPAVFWISDSENLASNPSF